MRLEIRDQTFPNKMMLKVILTISSCWFFWAVDGVVTTLQFTGAYQTLTLNSSSMYIVELYGAAGGDPFSTNAQGLGGYLRTELFLSAGQQLYVYVGGTPSSDGTGGFNGGGSVGVDSSIVCGGGGGGSTDIRTSKAVSSRLAVAGGGGGAAHDGTVNMFGGKGGGDMGGEGQDNSKSDTSYGGHGGNQTTGGFGGFYNNLFPLGSSGALFTGGSPTKCGGGGGGGYYGGGGGSWTGGGGGSSFSSGSSTTMTQGVRRGNGLAVISTYSDPTGQPSSAPTTSPFLAPTAQPSGQPTWGPTSPTALPSLRPTHPTQQPTGQPTSFPSPYNTPPSTDYAVTEAGKITMGVVAFFFIALLMLSFNADDMQQVVHPPTPPTGQTIPAKLLDVVQIITCAADYCTDVLFLFQVYHQAMEAKSFENQQHEQAPNSSAYWQCPGILCNDLQHKYMLHLIVFIVGCVIFAAFAAWNAYFMWEKPLLRFEWFLKNCNELAASIVPASTFKERSLERHRIWGEATSMYFRTACYCFRPIYVCRLALWDCILLLVAVIIRIVGTVVFIAANIMLFVIALSSSEITYRYFGENGNREQYMLITKVGLMIEDVPQLMLQVFYLIVLVVVFATPPTVLPPSW